jgi:hypothetical protein
MALTDYQRRVCRLLATTRLASGASYVAGGAALNEVLALVGRVEARDFVDTLACIDNVQPLGYLAWAACGKDPGFSPLAILEQAARSVRYSGAELAGLAFDGPPPDAAALAARWHLALGVAEEIVALLPPSEAGKAVLSSDGSPCRGDVPSLRGNLAEGSLRFHAGSIRGAFPSIVA